MLPLAVQIFVANIAKRWNILNIDMLQLTRRYNYDVIDHYSRVFAAQTLNYQERNHFAPLTVPYEI
jgi:hypothetical protein